MADQREVIQKLMEQVQKALLMKEDDITAALFNTYQTVLNQTIKDLLWLNQPVIGEEVGRSKWRALRLDQASIKMIAEHMTGLNQRVAQELSDNLVNFGQEAYNMTNWALDQGVPPTTPVEWNLPTDDVLKAFIASPWKGQMFSDQVGHISDTMARQLQQSLADGIMSGDSVRGIARKMRLNVGVPADEKLVTRPRASKQVYRALLIARDQAVRVANSMRERIYTENRKNMADRVWTAAPGLLGVCDYCADLGGMTYDEIKDEYGQETADSLLYGSCHPNGRCMYTLQPKPFQDLLPDSLKAAGEGVFGDSISEWEMKHQNPDDPGELVAMKVTPYGEWINQD